MKKMPSFSPTPPATSAHSWGHIREGDTVIVFGAGPVGLYAAESSWLMGAGRVIVVEMKKTTDYLGADVAIDAAGAEAGGSFIQNVTAAQFKLQGGSPVALNWAIDSVRKAGTVSVMGAYGPIFSAVKFGDALGQAR